MKKILALILVLALSASIFAACTPKEKTPAEPEVETVTEPVEEPVAEEPVAETPAEFTYPGGVRTGLAVITALDKTTAPEADKDGNAQSDSVVAAVLVGEDGRIVKASLDTAQNKIAFNAEGKLVTPLEEIFKSKKELGDAYNMKPASPIGKEWFEQAEVLTNYVIGKNVDELRAVALDADGVPTDADLAAGATMKSKGYFDAFIKAIETSEQLGATVEDGLGLGIITNMGQSKNAEADAEGLAQAYSSYVAVTANAEGKITSVCIDSSQSNVNFDATGVISTDITKPVVSKKELGDAYNMKPASPIGKEWFEQAKALADFLTGKTYEEVVGVAVVEGEVVEGSDLRAGVTMSVGDLTDAVAKAYKTAVETAGAATAATTEEPAATTEEPAVEEVPATEEPVEEVPAA